MKPVAAELLKAALTVSNLDEEFVTAKCTGHLMIVLEQIKLNAPKNTSGVSL